MTSYKNLPDTPGVYIFRNGAGKILYIGKAGNLKRRVSSYFLRPHDYRIQKLVSEIKKIECKKTDTAIEALILEAELIKKHQPQYNIREKDDTSFLFVEIVNEMFPRVLLVRGKDKPKGKRYGPFTSSAQAREALKIIRRIFPFSTHETGKLLRRPCFDYQLGLCPGTCIGNFSRTEYLKNIKNLELFFEGKKKKIIQNLKKEMAAASRGMEYEKADKFKRQLFALQHIQDVAFINEPGIQNAKIGEHRIEGYDISNISGISAVGSMVVFKNGKPDKNEYRKFKIKTIFKSDDTGMLKEILVRRFRNDWPKPELILIDGGRGQVNAAKEVLNKLALRIPIVGLAKGPERKKNELIGKIPVFTDLKTLIRIRDEAHRFAVSYHKMVRGRNFIKR
ncbi:MAG: GIY-YIG nuclease family protein [Minisyncoccia bacterium]|jgi:excinuclease ABC subunit C